MPIYFHEMTVEDVTLFRVQSGFVPPTTNVPSFVRRSLVRSTFPRSFVRLQVLLAFVDTTNALYNHVAIEL